MDKSAKQDKVQKISVIQQVNQVGKRGKLYVLPREVSWTHKYKSFKTTIVNGGRKRFIMRSQQKS